MHVFHGDHPCNLADGTPLAIGQHIAGFDAEHPHNAGLIRKGWLVPVVTYVGAPESESAESDKPARPTKAIKADPIKEG